MHVTPREVAGLQALARRHGTSLSTNPKTGLPEAFKLEDLAPALIGAAVDYFVPGAGEFVGGLVGADAAVGTGLLVGGATGLATGSLEKGLTAGLGAWGGASLMGSLGEAGSAANARAANAAFDSSNPAFDADRVAAIKAAAKPDVSAGFAEAASHPLDFLKDNKWAIGAAALPALASADQNTGIAALQNKGNIRKYRKNPVTGALEQDEVIPVDEFGNRSAVTFGGVGQPVKYDEGGLVGNHMVYDTVTKTYKEVNAAGEPLSPVNFGGVGKSTNIQPNDNKTDSQRAQDYLMGVPGATNPMLFYHAGANEDTGTVSKKNPLVPLDLLTRTGGHYVLNAAGTGYDWVPDEVAGLEALADKQGGDKRIADPVQNLGDGSGRLAEMGAVASNALGSAGQIALGKIANFFNPLPNLTPEQAAKVPVSDAFGMDMSEAGKDKGAFLPSPPVPAANPMSQDPAQAAQAAQGSGVIGVNGYGSESGTKGDGGRSGSDGGVGGFGGFGAANGATAGGAQGAHAGTGNGTGNAGGDGGDGGGVGGFGGRAGPGWAHGGIAALANGGYNLGSYSDGGRLLRGPGDGVSDSIPATIGKNQPARLADGEFVIPARIVSELGNGSTDAGAKRLYAMMDRIQAGRAKTIGKNKVATNSKADRHLPA